MIMSEVGLILIGACLGALIPMTISLLAQGRLRPLPAGRQGDRAHTHACTARKGDSLSRTWIRRAGRE
jgi:hypothetical protein